jgi:hypothetical protein
MINRSRIKVPALSIVVLLAITSIPVRAQTKNPNISLITDFRTYSRDDEGGLNLDLAEIECAVQGYLNPYARADVFFAKHGTEGPVEIEEAYATFLRGLPLGLNIKAGKFLVDFGKLNVLHPHAYPFVERPLVHGLFFGTDGLNDVAINASLLLPTADIYTKASFNVLKGDALKPHEHGIGEEENGHEDHAEDHGESESAQPLAYSGRLSAHFQISEYGNLEFGVSGLTGIHDHHEELRAMIGGVDVKYRWRPDRYRSLTLQAEALYSHRDVPLHEEEEHHDEHEEEEELFQSINSAGFFAFANMQFRRRWNIGLMSEMAHAPEAEDEKFWAHSAFAGFSPMEETSVIRLLLRREKRPGEEAQNVIMLQLAFSLGPHKPHMF